MVVFSIKVSNSNPATIVIGRRGTYNTQEVTFDLSYLVENYGNGTAVLMLKRSQDISAYPAVASQADNVLTWTVSDADTYYVGNGEAQLMWYVNDGLAKTIIYPMVVMRDIIGTTEDPPSGYENWIEQLVDLGEETLENAQAAEQSATNAANSAVEADNSATSAETSATTAEAAKDAAELYKNGAETAKTAAETAQSNAKTAQGKAEDAQASAEDSADRAEAALAEFTTPTASATTLSPDASATASYANGHFTFGIPKGNKGDPGDPGDPGVTPDFSIGTVETLQPTQPATASVTGTPEHPVLNLGIPKGAQGDPATNLVQSVNGKTGAVVLDSGNIAYESTTVEDELGTINSALSSLSAVTEIIDTASGAIASFPDGAGLPMRSLVAEINPVQDLHGQSSPYPPGGGKNKFPEKTLSLGKPNNRTKSVYFDTPIPAGNYVMSFTKSGTSTGGWGIGFYTASGSAGSVNVNTGNATITDTAVRAYFYMDQTDYDNNLTIELDNIQLESGSTATAWTPYSNLCPISGWTGVSGKVTGKNLLPNLTAPRATGSIYIGQNTANVYPTHLVGGSTYTLIFNADGTDPLAYYQTNGGATTFWGASGTSQTFQEDADVRLWVYASGLTSVSGFQLELSSTASPYEPYTSEAISVSWQDEAGTVYDGSATYNGDGTWTVVSDMAKKQMTYAYLSSLSSGFIGYSSSVPRFDRRPGIWVRNWNYSEMAGMRLGGIKSACNAYNIAVHDSSIVSTQYRIYFDANTTDVSAFLSQVQGLETSGDNLWIAYELATPLTYTITTEQLLTTLYGQNNVWVDTGDVSVTYQASVKGYIDKLRGA